ncbi:MAG: class I SAM-dependent methyltransferase [Clostridia bacterium]|nr:class I SAM-dependent methyltransferase [Clostridia bacterium]
MKNEDIIAFFDRWASGWDADMIRDDGKIGFILDAAHVVSGTRVLDIACGTGVLFPDYLARSVSHVDAVDISPEMARIAAQKAAGSCISVHCGDAQSLSLPGAYDCCVIYNAFPHFTQPEKLIAHLAAQLRTGGTLCIAHSMSLNALHQHHERARSVSREMFTAEALGAMMAPYFDMETLISDEEKFVVAGKKR